MRSGKSHSSGTAVSEKLLQRQPLWTTMHCQGSRYTVSRRRRQKKSCYWHPIERSAWQRRKFFSQVFIRALSLCACSATRLLSAPTTTTTMCSLRTTSKPCGTTATACCLLLPRPHFPTRQTTHSCGSGVGWCRARRTSLPDAPSSSRRAVRACLPCLRDGKLRLTGRTTHFRFSSSLTCS